MIGDHTFLGHGCSSPSVLRFGSARHCLLAGGVSSFRLRRPPHRRRAPTHEPRRLESIKPVVIGDDVWIGADAKILKGVTIGDRSIVGRRGRRHQVRPAPTSSSPGIRRGVVKHLVERSADVR